MRLPKELFDGIVGSARTVFELTRDDRRASGRAWINRKATMRVGSGTSTVAIRDISMVGVALLASRWLVAGDPFTLDVPAADGVGVAPLSCVVVRCDPSSGGLFVIGATFTGSMLTAAPPPARSNSGKKPLEEDDVQAARVREAMFRPTARG